MIGEGRMAEFELLVTRWANNDPVFLWCDVMLCDPASSDCVTTDDCTARASGRRRRDITDDIILDDFVEVDTIFHVEHNAMVNGPIFPISLQQMELTNGTNV